LQHFVETYPDRPSPAGLDRDTAAPERSPPGDKLEQRIQALGFDAAAAPWVRQRVDAYLTAMLHHFGLDYARLQGRFRLELLAAETRCAACRETTRCRRFLAGAAAGDTPPEFCPNASAFDELARRDRSRERRR
jgi:hypothetical protein